MKERIVDGVRWREVEGFEGYWVSEDGRVLGVKGRVLRPLECNGYKQVSLRNEKRYIHRLIAEAFIPNIENKPQVNHIDGVKSNNHCGNLEWVTGKENCEHRESFGLSNYHYGEKSGMSKLTNEQTLFIYHSDLPQKELCSMFNISRGTVYRIKNGLRNQKVTGAIKP